MDTVSPSQCHANRPWRHDNDRKLPRTPSEIYDLNRSVAAKMQKVFSSRNIPVIPSLGALPWAVCSHQSNSLKIPLQATMTSGVRPRFFFVFLDMCWCSVSSPCMVHIIYLGSSMLILRPFLLEHFIPRYDTFLLRVFLSNTLHRP